MATGKQLWTQDLPVSVEVGWSAHTVSVGRRRSQQHPGSTKHCERRSESAGNDVDVDEASDGAYHSLDHPQREPWIRRIRLPQLDRLD